MPSTKNTAIVAAVIVVVIAAALFTFLRDSGDDDGDGFFIDTEVNIGDSYTFDTMQYVDGQDSGTSTSVTVTVISVSGDEIVSEHRVDSTTYTLTETCDTFLSALIVQDLETLGDYQRTETIDTIDGSRECIVFLDWVDLTDDVLCHVYSWVPVGSNVIVKTESFIIDGSQTSYSSSNLDETNMLVGYLPDDAIVPESVNLHETVRENVVIGDYIEFSVYEGDHRNILSYSVSSVTDDILWIYQDGMNQIPVETYLSLIRYDGNGTEIANETIDSSFGSKDCTIYRYDSYEGLFDIGSAGTVLFWADSETDIVYMIGLVTDSGDPVFYYLTGTSLLGPEPDPPIGENGGTTVSSQGYPISIGDHTSIEMIFPYATVSFNITVVNVTNNSVVVLYSSGWMKSLGIDEYAAMFVLTQSQIDDMEFVDYAGTSHGELCSIYSSGDHQYYTIYNGMYCLIAETYEPAAHGQLHTIYSHMSQFM